MPKKKYLVDLSADERESLRQLVKRGKHSARQVTRARILLLASTGATDEQIVAALCCGINTVERTRRRFVGSPKLVDPCPRVEEQSRGLITNTNATACAISFCSVSRSVDGGTSKSPSS